MQKINIIQFLPYYPPHKGGLETHAQERGKWREKKGYGEVINVVFDIGYFKKSNLNKNIILLPALELIPTFPIPKFWKRQFRKQLKKIKQTFSSLIERGDRGDFTQTIVITRTRFFTSSLVGGIFAKRNKLKRTHIEHGVDYVKLNAKRKEQIAWMYDQTIGRRIFRNSDQVIGISQACKRFANKFTKKDIPVIYRGLEFSPSKRKEYRGKIVRIGFVGRLVKLKGVDLLIRAFEELYKQNKNISLTIVGDGEEKNDLVVFVKKLKLEEQIKFLGYKDKKYISTEFFPNIDIVVNPSYQEGLPTSVLEGLLSGCVVVATDVGGTKEISNMEDLILVEKGSIRDIKKGLENVVKNYKIHIGLSYKHVEHNFNWEISIKKYFNELNQK